MNRRGFFGAASACAIAPSVDTRAHLSAASFKGVAFPRASLSESMEHTMMRLEQEGFLDRGKLSTWSFKLNIQEIGAR